MATVTVAGAGPAGLIAAETLAHAGVSVVVCERMANVGRKFLLAGRGGLNLTHSEALDVFLTRYRPAEPQLLDAVRAFSPADLRAWSDGLGEATFVGTSGRVFPASFRAAPLMRAWLRRLGDLGVELRRRTAVTDFAAPPRGSDALLLALGGASWPRTGSDGAWADALPHTPLRPSNAGFVVAWSEVFTQRYAGTPLKDVGLSCGTHASRGDAVVTAMGIEGGAVYAISAPMRDAIERDGDARLRVDTRPDQSVDAIARRLARRRPKSTTTAWLDGAGVAPVVVALMREATGNAIPSDAGEVARLLKALPIRVDAMQPIDRAISSAGGVPFDAIDDGFMLRGRHGVFVAGEMLDWEAPTGGYLLQGCFSTGVAAARGVLRYLNG